MHPLVTDPSEQLSGRELRRLTARAAAARSGSGAAEVLSTVASAVVCTAVVVGLVVGAADAVRGVLTLPGAGDAAAPVLSLGVVRLLLWAAVAALAGSLAARLGPVGVSDAGLRWWVPTAVDRSGLLVGSWWAALGAWAVGTSVAATLVAVVTGMPPTLGTLGAVSLLGAATGALVVASVGLLQAGGRGRPAQRVADGLVALVPLLGAVAVVVGGVRPDLDVPAAADRAGGAAGLDALSPPVALVVTLLVAASALVAAVVWRRTLGRVEASVLAERAGTAQHVGASALSLDTRELARALGRGRPGRPRRASRRLRLARGPASALLHSEVLALVRAPGVLLGTAALAGAAVVAQQVPALGSGGGLVVVAAVVGLRAAQAGARGAAEADVVPALDAMLPLGSRSTRLVRTVVPALTSAVVVVTSLAAAVRGLDGALWSWVLLLALAGAGFGAAAVRGAYRKPPDWSAPLLATPAGALPTGAVVSAARGPDLALLVVVPVGVALVAGTVTPVLLVAQTLVAVVAVLVASSVPATDQR
ncbi:hypothetical protein Sked_23400 [Sanguibacter keddieii DSM 10542]|uniref:Uncharacterized protein n=1 Tax=Sanguibacter keddieii (strain ATCC 51767 / DSM 10542 / NCFB 3025 / ST-74) TaxID=446469 RepID=D1BJ61_SANKS|nr:DUF6297 family protein [Sanguibacter keddieii]ACZ22255.1 hypothetical protein Sked_23400 [Sanguibacter keddieii DSM 10542]